MHGSYRMQQMLTQGALIVLGVLSAFDVVMFIRVRDWDCLECYYITVFGLAPLAGAILGLLRYALTSEAGPDRFVVDLILACPPSRA